MYRSHTCLGKEWWPFKSDKPRHATRPTMLFLLVSHTSMKGLRIHTHTRILANTCQRAGSDKQTHLIFHVIHFALLSSMHHPCLTAIAVCVRVFSVHPRCRLSVGRVAGAKCSQVLVTLRLTRVARFGVFHVPHTGRTLWCVNWKVQCHHDNCVGFGLSMDLLKHEGGRACL